MWGRVEMVPWRKGDKDLTPFARIAIERVATPDWTLPAEEPPRNEAEDAELDALPW